MRVLDFVKTRNVANGVVQPSANGISMDYLVEFNDRLFKGYEAPGVQLFLCNKSSPSYGKRYSLRLETGDTVQFKYEIEADVWHGYVPNKGEGTFDPRLVRPKIREEWTIEDVCEYVVKPITQRSENAGLTYVDTLRTGQRGKAYKGVFVYADAKKTAFRSFIHSMASVFDSITEQEDTYMWLDVFCATQHKALQAKNVASDVANIASKYSQHMLYFAAPINEKNLNEQVTCVVMDGLFVNDHLMKVVVEYSLVQSIANILAHVQYMKSILGLHALLFGGGHVDAKAKMKGKLAKKKLDKLGRTKVLLPSMNVKGKKGKGKKGGKISFMSDMMEMSSDEVLMNDGLMNVLNEFLPERQRPELARDDFLESFISKNAFY